MLRKRGERTNLHAVPAKEEAGKNHLTESKHGPKGREEAYGCDTKQVDEKDGEEGIDKTKLEDGDRECSNGKTGDDHIGSKPLFRSSVIPFEPQRP